MPILKEGQLDMVSHSAEQTQRLGFRLGQLLAPGDVVCLVGDMGAGKTVFSAGIGNGWGAQTPLTSPTYHLMHRHNRTDGLLLYHLDCYRIDEAQSEDVIDLDRVFNKRHVVVLEWPDRIQGLLPKTRLWVNLRMMDLSKRSFSFTPVGKHYETLLKKFRESAFGI